MQKVNGWERGRMGEGKCEQCKKSMSDVEAEREDRRRRLTKAMDERKGGRATPSLSSERSQWVR